jgi:hypothetical protein
MSGAPVSVSPLLCFWRLLVLLFPAEQARVALHGAIQLGFNSSCNMAHVTCNRHELIMCPGRSHRSAYCTMHWKATAQHRRCTAAGTSQVQVSTDSHARCCRTAMTGRRPLRACAQALHRGALHLLLRMTCKSSIATFGACRSWWPPLTRCRYGRLSHTRIEASAYSFAHHHWTVPIHPKHADIRSGTKRQLSYRPRRDEAHGGKTMRQVTA